MPFRSTEILSPGPADLAPIAILTLAHDQRHVRRKLIHLPDDDVVMLDLRQAVMLADGDLLVLEGGGHIRIEAAEEPLYEVRGHDARHLTELAWHLGNRHLPAAIEENRILILRDPVMLPMLDGLSATVREVVEPFQPARGAYHHGGHDHGHQHASGHAHG